MPARHLLLDYGEVVSRPQPREAVARMARAADLDVAEFERRYWRHRPGYDLGQPADAYWTEVLGEPAGRERVQRLVELDVASWLHVDPALPPLLELVRARGTRLSLLSNAPHELARALRGHPALTGFAPLLFSAELGVMKPDPRIYAQAAERLQAAPGDIVFVDDRASNVQGAQQAGLQAIHYRGTPACRASIAEAVQSL